MIEQIFIEYRGVFVAIAIALLGILARLYIGRVNAFRGASTEFRDAFNDVIAILSHPITSNETSFTYKTLTTTFDKHYRAYIAFKNFLPFYKTSDFDKAWQEYTKHQANFSKEWPEHEQMNHFGEYLTQNSEDEQKVKILALTRIKKLLSYAKPI